ncbi:MAG: glycoside hydrolase family 3 C-terminal domain-containing protein [Sedimentisphaerales bacterium]|nr:glycoside hydrolase family 3 C-terminal domain-containing protein [Sedimentisphaerales bacterium]
MVAKRILFLAVIFVLLMCLISSARLKSDFDESGDITIDDLFIFAQHWLDFDIAPCHGDTDDDCDVDIQDFARLSEQWLGWECNFTATASSTEDTQYAPSMALDNNFYTRWSSDWADNQWIQIDMGETRTFFGLKIYWETAYASQYQIQVSNNASNWTSVYSTSSGTGGYPDDISFGTQSARYIRIYCNLRATPWGNSIWEIVLKSDDNCMYRDDFETYINTLIAAMTLEEKTTFLYGETAMNLRSFPTLGIPELNLADGPVGIRWDQATAFPASIALSSTWDVDLARQFGVAMGKEWKNKGRHVWLGPCMNIVRVPHGGRNFETYGEDPYLNSRMAVATISGAQSENIIACAKHFAANNQEYNRTTINIQVSERALREIYLPAFKAAVTEAGAWAVMTAYNRLNGAYCTENSYLQKDILKDEWGFKGFVVSDWGAVHSTVNTANNGLDLEMDGASPVGAYWGNGQLLSAVTSGYVTEATIDDKVKRILRAMFSSGILQQPNNAPDVEMIEHRALAREIAQDGIVLLKNDSDILPLDKNTTQTIALIGPNYKDARTGGGGSSYVTPFYSIGPLEGIQNLVGPGTTLLEALGAPSSDSVPTAIDSSYLRLPDDSGPGLQGEYYNNTTLSGSPVLTRTDLNVDFDWGSGSPDGSVNSDGFSVRWTGKLNVPVSDWYDIATATDDGVRLYINGGLVIDDWNDHALKTNTYSVYLDAATTYNIEMRYYENGGEAVAILGWNNITELLNEAIAAATAADISIVFAGLSSSLEGEGSDRPSMDLNSEQVTLIQQVAAANPNTIVVMIAGSQVGMDTWIDDVPAMMQAWYGGQEAGTAIADVLFGEINPSGKLPMTFVRQWSDHPCYSNYPGNVYTEGIYLGYRHFDKYAINPLFAFGHGLSYTPFQYSNLNIDDSLLSTYGKVIVTCEVQNTGSRSGAEIVQLYIRDIAASVDRPEKELKRFTKVLLDPAQTEQVTFELDLSALSYYDVSGSQWYAEPGIFEVQIGSSSRDIRLTGTFELF